MPDLSQQVVNAGARAVAHRRSADARQISRAVLSAALDACPVLGLTEAELNALLLAADTGIPGLNPVASEDYCVMVALARAGDKLRAALRPVEREPDV